MNSASHRCALVVMAKAPLRGAAKSRLMPPLTAEEAAELSRCFIRDVCTAIEGAIAMIPAAAKVQVKGIVAYTPARTEALFEGLVPASFEFIEQRGEGLGERLINVAGDLLSAGFESVAMMNSDSPTIPPRILGEAIRNLVMLRSTSAETVASLYASAADPKAKKAVIDGLFARGDAKPLIDLARKETDPAMKKQIVERLALMHSKEATDYMMELLK